ncbi:MAG: hypothetical protein ACJ702_02630, partial [Nitrososphaeraceae archaeon]
VYERNSLPVCHLAGYHKFKKYTVPLSCFYVACDCTIIGMKTTLLPKYNLKSVGTREKSHMT